MSDEKNDENQKKQNKPEKTKEVEIKDTKTEEKKQAEDTPSSEQKNSKVEPKNNNEKTDEPKKEEAEKAVEFSAEEEIKTAAAPKEIYPDVKPGATVRIHQKIKEKKGKETKERIQIFEGIVLIRKHGNEVGATITVRKIAKGGFAVEKIYPLHSPVIDKIEVVKQAVVRQSKLGFLRNFKKKLKIIKT